MSDWISTKHRLPSKSGNYLIVVDGIIGIFHYSARWQKFNAYDESKTLTFACESVTHWRPLPEPPKEVNRDA